MFAVVKFILVAAWCQQTTVYYSSPALAGKALKPDSGYGMHHIQDDNGELAPVFLVEGADGYSYWYRRVFTEVCLTGECRPIDIGIFWRFTGKYLGVEVYREPLTKTDHTNFSVADYACLESILQDEWSKLREYTMAELVEPADAEARGVDGVTGATRQSVSAAAVDNAVYTTHTMWHLVHVGEGEQLAITALTMLAENPALRKRLLAGNAEHRDFVLAGILNGYLSPDSVIESAVFKGIAANHRPFRDFSLKVLGKLDVSTDRVQNALAETYPTWTTSERMRVLAILEGVDSLSSTLRKRLVAEFKVDTTPWLLLRIAHVLKNAGAELTADERRFLRDFKTDHAALQEMLETIF